MTVDSERDLQGLKAIGRVVALTLQEMKRHVRPGVTTLELDQIGGEVLHKHGARSAPRLVYNFPGETCISLNDEAAHGIPGSRRIQPGDLVNLDVSAEMDGYFADSGLTVAVPPVSAEKQRLLDCTQAALRRAIRVAQAGVKMNQIGLEVERQAQRCEFTILRDLCGHGVGRSIHESPHNVLNFFYRQDERLLEDGQVLTIEPFLSNGSQRVFPSKDGWTLRTEGGHLSAQFEHTLVIRHGRPVVTTSRKTAD
ncbi:MAG: type I methionyl aminopeptidase [Anaerolineales bacterium]